MNGCLCEKELREFIITISLGATHQKKLKIKYFRT